MTTVDIYADPALEVLEAASKSVAYHYGAWVAENDLYQSAWEWRLRHPQLVSSFLEREEGADVNGLQRVVQTYLTTLARREKALACGYHPDDECFYVPAVVAELLPLTLDIESALLPSVVSDDDSVSGSGNPHGQGDFVASLLDVRRAWINTAFRGDEMSLIKARYIEDLEWGEIAASFQVDLETAKRRTAIGLRRMSDYLGGLPSRGCKQHCECKEGENP